MAKFHPECDEVHQYASSSACLACGLDFTTRLRLCRHLWIRSRACLSALREFCKPLSKDEVDSVKEADSKESAQP